ncbi:hypothetical protein M9Y10_026053 [Tritrichomonas musculus]|uniref:Uncharacterized protein n=1 Tax=Tritrichomonas musculus TaxID=1915356 RepID=A0ABR2H9A5_9EUKA
MLFYLVSFAFSALIAPHEEKSFLSWMRTSNQFYTGDEYHFRLGIYLSNARRVQEFNSAKNSFKLSLNKFACYTPAEYKTLLGRRQSQVQPRQSIVNKYKGDEPSSIDWREKGAVNEIKDQGQCGSCWAFGTVQACESAYAIAHGKLYSCSEQEILDCCEYCSGCDGGAEDVTLDYIIRLQDGFLMSEEDYPYKFFQTRCAYDKSKRINQIKGYIHGEKGDEDALKTLISQGVCDIGIDATKFSFQLYSGGIYDEPSCSSRALNHAVGLVGYGSMNDVDYWIVRNSWGKAWGEKGYIRMSRNKNNQCGVATDPLQVQA